MLVFDFLHYLRMCESSSYDHVMLENSDLDSLCSILELRNVSANESEGQHDAPPTFENIRTTCQELLLRLHPDKVSINERDKAHNTQNSGGSQFRSVLKAWKILSKYSSEGTGTEMLMRQVLARQHELKRQQEESTVSKPLWRIIQMRNFDIGNNIYNLYMLILYVIFIYLYYTLNTDVYALYMTLRYLIACLVEGMNE